MRILLCLLVVLAIATPAAAKIIINMPGAQGNGTIATTQPESVQPIPDAAMTPAQIQERIDQLQKLKQQHEQQQVPGAGQGAGQGAGPGQQAPAQVCTQMWCQEGVSIILPPISTPGDYRFSVTADGQMFSCHGRLPLPPCGQQAVTCDRPGLVVQESGCAMPPETHSFYGLFLSVVPKNIEVSIAMPGRSPISFAGPTNAKCFYPNGPQCDPRACCQAQINILP